MKNIAIITGGNSAEYKISLQSAQVVKANICKEKYTGIIVHIKDDTWEAVTDKKNYKINKEDFSFLKGNETVYFDFVFMALHGPPAENGELQIKLDKIGIPYSCSGAKESAITFNKFKCIEYAKKLGFQCAKSYFYIKGKKIDREEILQKVGLPCFVKPNAAGSSFGVSKVEKKEELENAIYIALSHDNEVLIEQYIEGTEVSCGIFKHNELEGFPLTEIVSHNDFFDFEAKYK